MARKAKKLQELKGIFEENEVDFELFDDVTVLKELRESLDIITDTRHESYIKHKLLDVIMITLLAVLANANEWIEVECFAKKKEKWLKEFLELPNGIPSDDTIRIVISSINPNYLYNIVLEFLISKIDGLLNTFNKNNNPL